MLARTLTLIAKKNIFFILTSILVSLSLLYSLAFLFTVYPADSRVLANTYVEQHIHNATTIVEPYDLGAMPFTSTFPKSQIINFYDLDKNSMVQQQLQIALRANTIFLSPSQRLWSTRLADKYDFPYGYDFYKKLFNGALGYKVIYQTPCNFWCTLVYMGNPATSIEATASVFDHPVVTIFQHE